MEISKVAICDLKERKGTHRKYLPYAFTEHGALMAANILNSPRAVAMSVYVIRAFIKIRSTTPLSTTFTKNFDLCCSLLPLRPNRKSAFM